MRSPRECDIGQFKLAFHFWLCSQGLEVIEKGLSRLPECRADNLFANRCFMLAWHEFKHDAIDFGRRIEATGRHLANGSNFKLRLKQHAYGTAIRRARGGEDFAAYFGLHHQDELGDLAPYFRELRQ